MKIRPLANGNNRGDALDKDGLVERNGAQRSGPPHAELVAA